MSPRAVLAVTVAVLVCALPTNAAAATGELAEGQQSSMWLDQDTGTAHVVWSTWTSGASTARGFYCRLPRTAVVCEATKELFTSPTGDQAPTIDIAREPGGKLVVFFSHSAPGNAAVRTSSDNGTTFGSAQSLAAMGDWTAIAPGPGNDVISLVRSSGTDHQYRQQHLGAPADAGAAVYGNSTLAELDVAVAPDGRPVASFSRSPQDGAFNALETLGAPNATASWGAPTALPGVRNVQLAAAKTRLWLSYTPSANTDVLVRTYDAASGFAAGSSIPGTAGDEGDGALGADDGGGVHFAWENEGVLCYTHSPNGTAFSGAIRLGLVSDGEDNMQIAASGAGSGRVLYEADGKVMTTTIADAVGESPNTCGTPPSVSLDPPAPGTTTAGLSGTVQTQGQTTTAFFELAQGDGPFGKVGGDQTLAGSTVASSPVSATATGLTPGATYRARLTAVNASGTAQSTIVTFTTTTAARPPGLTGTPELPDDGDRVAGGVDLCGTTPAGQRAVLNGCSLAELVVSPTLAVAPAREAVDDARLAGAGVRKERVLRRNAEQVATRLTRADRQLRAAGNELDRLDFCDASKQAGGALSNVRAASRTATSAIRSGESALDRLEKRQKLPPAGVVTEADSMDEERSMLGWQAREAKAAVGDVQRAARGLRGLCRGSKVRTVSGEVAGIAVGGILPLSNGTKVSVAGYEGKAMFVPGISITATGPTAGGVVHAERIVAKARPKKAIATRCLTLGIVPVQLGPLRVPTHPLGGYLVGGKLLLEEGMLMRALRNPCNEPGAGGKTVKRALQVVLTGGGSTLTWNTDHEKPAFFASPGFVGKALSVKVTELRYTCAGTNCDAAQVVGATDSLQTLPILERGGAGAATYPQQKARARNGAVAFSVPDAPGPGNFQTTTLGFTARPDLPAPRLLTFAAIPFGPGHSTHGFVVEDGGSIAIRADDHPEALDGPQIVGTRNGFPYAYQASQPKVVTDMVAECPGDPDAYFQLPFPQGKRYTVWQGAFTPNDPKASHRSAYAWDWGMPKGAEITAARGGQVVEVVANNETNWVENAEAMHGLKWAALNEAQQLSALVPNNYLYIEHQDETVSSYAHFPKDSPFVKVGQKVRRGDKIAPVGEVGQAIGGADPTAADHLHFASGLSVADKDESKVKPLFAGASSANANGPYVATSCGYPSAGQWWERSG